MPKLAFQRFLNVSKHPKSLKVKTKGMKVEADGGILIWGKVDKYKKQEICDLYGFFDILSLEDIISDLIRTKNKEYKEFLSTLHQWNVHLIRGLGGDV